MQSHIIKANAGWGSLQPIEPLTSLDDYLETRFERAEEIAQPAAEDPQENDDDIDPTPRGGVNFKGTSLKNDDYRSS